MRTLLVGAGARTRTLITGVALSERCEAISPRCGGVYTSQRPERALSKS